MKRLIALVTLAALLIEFSNQEALYERELKIGRRLYSVQKRRKMKIAKSIVSNDGDVRYGRIPLSGGDRPSVDPAIAPPAKIAIQLWPSTEIAYDISDSIHDKKERRVISMAISAFTMESCVKWVPRKRGDKDYVLFVRSQTVSANLGRIGGEQTIELNAASFSEVGHVLHEMLHVLGFIHEHQRIDRDKWIGLNTVNLKPSWYNQFHKIDTPISAVGKTLYDFASVMHYGVDAGAINSNRRTIIPRVAGVVLGQRGRLSETDVEEINLMYCSDLDPMPNPQAQTSRNCLLVFGGEYSNGVPPYELYPLKHDGCKHWRRRSRSLAKFLKPPSYRTNGGCYFLGSSEIIVAGRDKHPSHRYALERTVLQNVSWPLTLLYPRGQRVTQLSDDVCLSCGAMSARLMLASASAESTLSDCFQYNATASSRWIPSPALPQRTFSGAIVTLGPGHTYYLGGHDGVSAVRMAFRYDERVRRWSRVTDMPEWRWLHAAAKLSDRELIACGGTTPRSQSDDTCVIYSADSDLWRRAASMNKGRTVPTMISYAGKVYVVGDDQKQNTQRVKSIESYDPSKNEWQMERPLRFLRLGPTVYLI